MTFLLSDLKDDEERLAYLPEYMSILLKAATLNKATIEEVDDWKACGIMLPPGCSIGNPETREESGLLSIFKKLPTGYKVRSSLYFNILWELTKWKAYDF
jgi:hypothetical protein